MLHHIKKYYVTAHLNHLNGKFFLLINDDGKISIKSLNIINGHRKHKSMFDSERQALLLLHKRTTLLRHNINYVKKQKETDHDINNINFL